MTPKGAAPNPCRAGFLQAVGVAETRAEAVSGPAEIREIPGAGHMAEFDRPDAVADAIAEFPAAC